MIGLGSKPFLTTLITTLCRIDEPEMIDIGRKYGDDVVEELKIGQEIKTKGGKRGFKKFLLRDFLKMGG